MKSKKNFKKKHHNYRKAEEPIRIKEKRRRPKKFNKNAIYDLLQEEDDNLELLNYQN